MATTIKADMEGVICAWVSHQAAACAHTLRTRALSSIAVTAPATNETGAKHKRRSIKGTVGVGDDQARSAAFAAGGRDAPPMQPLESCWKQLYQS